MSIYPMDSHRPPLNEIGMPCRVAPVYQTDRATKSTSMINLEEWAGAQRAQIPYINEWTMLLAGSLDNMRTPADPPNRRLRSWWCDWVHRVRLYGYDPAEVFPWPRTRQQREHDEGLRA